MRAVETELGPAYVVETREGATWLWDWLKTRRGDWLAWDGETNGHDPWDHSFRLRAAQISDGQIAAVIRAEATDFGTRMLDVVRECTRAHPTWVAHYAENDMRFAERGVPGSVRLDSVEPHFADTQTMLAWYDPRTVTGRDVFSSDGRAVALNNGLKPTTARVLGTDVLVRAEGELTAWFRGLAPVGKRTIKACKSWGFEHADTADEIYIRYAALDALCEARMAQKMAAELVAQGQWPEVYKDLRRQWHIDLMTFRGMPANPAYVKWLEDHFNAVIRDNAAFLDSCGVAPSGMGPSIGRAFRSLGVRSTRTTDKGAESWDRVVIDSIVDNEHLATTPEHHKAVELAKALTKVRQATKFQAAYIQPMRDTEGRDGRVHCSMRAIGAVTHRMSAARPAMQQMPKRTSQLIRAAFEAPEGWVFVSADLKQGEPRVMAALSGDRNLQADIEVGDINSTLAELTYPGQFINDPKEFKDASTLSYILRDRGKRGFLADKYGCATRKLASSQLLKVPREQAQAIKDRWAQRYDQLETYREWCNNQKALVLENGWVVPLWDRYAFRSQDELYCTDKPSRKGLNGATQGNQALLLDNALDLLVAWGWSWALVMLVHDEIVGLVPCEHAEAFRAALEAAMTTTFKDFPIRCDATIDGRSWMPQTEFDAEMAAQMAADME